MENEDNLSKLLDLKNRITINVKELEELTTNLFKEHFKDVLFKKILTLSGDFLDETSEYLKIEIFFSPDNVSNVVQNRLKFYTDKLLDICSIVEIRDFIFQIVQKFEEEEPEFNLVIQLKKHLRENIFNIIQIEKSKEMLIAKCLLEGDNVVLFKELTVLDKLIEAITYCLLILHLKNIINDSKNGKIDIIKVSKKITYSYHWTKDRNSLINFYSDTREFFEESTIEADFIKVFNCEIIEEIKPLRWRSGKVSEILFLIRYLNIYKLIDEGNRNNYTKFCNCFCGPNEEKFDANFKQLMNNIENEVSKPFQTKIISLLEKYKR